ncbi:MAG: hypothetical protein FJ100_18785 [Deltaproteobacteria bacterium]|nr:hypothetical protein [Deltaproteobacteria bacterium]
MACPPSADPCKGTACDPKTLACATADAPDGTACDDGKVTTAGDICKSGVCTAGTDTALCAADIDCKDDGDLCNGVPFCNKAKKTCEVNPATVVVCPSAGNTACIKNTCQKLTGLCLPTAVTPGTPCEDGEACSVGDICVAGACKAGTNTCLCKSDAECAGKDDGNLCNGTLFCNLQSGACQWNPASVVTCPTVNDTACTKAKCEPKSGKCEPAPMADSTPCDDGSKCTDGDNCQGGQCAAGTFICACKADADCKAEEDGDLCNGTLYCDKGATPAKCKVNPATVITCPSGGDTACLKSTCNQATGKCGPAPVADFTPCEDGQACTKNDACLFGKCQPGDYVCECNTAVDCQKKDDGDLCNGTWYCDKTGTAPVCAENPASVVFCPKTNDGACGKNTCDPKTGQCGLKPAADGTACSDGSKCTQVAACKAGVCKATASVSCDDGDICTADSCDPAAGCVHKGANCADGNPCSVDSCDPKTGQCAFATAPLEGKACNADDDGCTVGDTCLKGTCKKGVAVLCKVAVAACEQVACSSSGPQSFACVVSAATDGLPCEGTDACLLGAQCQGGVCAAGKLEKLFVQTHAGPVGTLELRAAALHPAGGLVAVGRRPLPLPGQPTATAWHVGRVDAAGAVTWQAALPAGTPETAVGAVGVDVPDDGQVVVAGTLRPIAGEGLQARIVRLGADGNTTVWQQDYGMTGAVDDAAADLAPHPAGGWLLAGSKTTAAAPDAWLVRVADSGKQLWQWQSSAVGADALRSVVVLPGGTALGVGHAEAKPGVRKGLAVRVDAQGSPLWQVELGDGPWQELHGAAATGDGALLAGTRTQAGVTQWWLVQVDQAGAAQWQQTGTGSREVRGIADLGGGVWALAGASLQDPKNTQPWLAGVAGDGHLLWEATYDAGAPASLAGVRATLDGGIGAVGTAAVSGNSVGLVVRSDAWGRAGCKASGTCAGKNAADCDDGKACTDDWCEPKKGCTPIGNSQSCSDGDACTVGDLCKLGVCAPGKAADCNDKEPCTADSCDKVKGCQHQTLQGLCDDGNPCTEGEGCQAGVCKGKPAVCDDGDTCTSNGCDPAKGCVFAADPKACDDGNGCTDDTCAKAAGCKHANNTAACDAGNPCTLGDVCAVGACTTGAKAKLFGVSPQSLGVDSAYYAGQVPAVLPRGDGGSVVAYYSPKTKALGAAVASLAPDGTKEWVTPIGGAGDNAVEALAATGKGGWIVAGRTTTGSAGGYDGRATLLGANGAKVWDYTYGGTNDDEFYAVETLADGTFALAGRTKTASKGGWDGWLVRVSADGVWMGESRFGGSEHDELVAVAAAADGDVVLAGGTGSSGAGTYDGWVVRADKAGSAVWKHSYGTVGTDVLLDIVALPDGDFAVGGRWSDGTVGKCWIARLDGAGRTRWNWLSPGTQGLTHITRVQSQPDGTIAALGTLGDAATVFRVDFAGRNATWSKMEANAPQPHHGWATADGGWWIAGSSETFAVVRTGAWGQFNCASAGKCAGLSHGSCQDQNPCTTGTCEPAKGCVQATNTDPCDAGASCTAGDKCGGGACQPGGPKLFDAVAPGTAETEELLGTTLLRDGSFAVAGRKSAYPWLLKLDVMGALLWQTPLLTPAHGWCGSVAELADGRLAVACTVSDSGAAFLSLVDRLGVAITNVQLGLVQSEKGAAAMKLVTVGDDDLVIAAVQPSTGAFVTRTTANGAKVWSTAFGQNGDAATGLAVLKGGDVVVGLQLGGKVSLARLNPGGATTWQVPLLDDEPANLSAVVAMPDGGAAASGWLDVSGKGTPFVARASASGTILWTWKGKVTGYSVNAQAVAVTAGGIAVSGSTQADTTQQSIDGWLAGLTVDGHLMWERKLGGNDRDVLYGLNALPGGGLFAVGHTKSKGAGGFDGWLIRTDAWGQLPCAVSGPCAKADFTSCDDSDGCTLDVCLPLGGCKHDPVVCGNGKECKAGVCGL